MNRTPFPTKKCFHIRVKANVSGTLPNLLSSEYMRHTFGRQAVRLRVTIRLHPVVRLIICGLLPTLTLTALNLYNKRNGNIYL